MWKIPRNSMALRWRHSSTESWSRSDFSIKLDDSFDSDLSPESGLWDNNHCILIFRQNWENSQNEKFQLIGNFFSLRTILSGNSCHFTDIICTVLPKSHTTMIISHPDSGLIFESVSFYRKIQLQLWERYLKKRT